MTPADFWNRTHAIRTNTSFAAQDHATLWTTLETEWNRALRALLQASGALKASTNNDDTWTATSGKWFQQLYQQHTESGRYYHTAVHLWEMLQYLKVLETKDGGEGKEVSQESTSSACGPAEGAILRLAIFFHDAIYDPKSSRNERDSMELLDKFWKDLEQQEQIGEVFGTPKARAIHSRISTLILATEKHQVLEEAVVIPTTGAVNPGEESEHTSVSVCCSWSLVELQKVFLDMDMAVLGKEAKAYQAYAALIRSEYAHVPKELYCSKRAEILQGFVNRPSPIFLTDLMQEALEETARSNLRAEIKTLQEGLIPGME